MDRLTDQHCGSDCAFSPASTSTPWQATNLELLKLTLESDGQNLVRGLALLAEDLERSADHPTSA